MNELTTQLEVMRIPKRGVICLFGNEYSNRDLERSLYDGEPVIVRFDARDMSQVELYRLTEAHIGQVFKHGKPATFTASDMNKKREERRRNTAHHKTEAESQLCRDARDKADDVSAIDLTKIRTCDLAHRLAIENAIKNYRAKMTLEERVLAVAFLLDYPTELRSPEYKAGMRSALNQSFSVREDACQFELGTAACDAWRTGYQDGLSRYHNWRKPFINVSASAGAAYWALFAQSFPQGGVEMADFWEVFVGKFALNTGRTA